MEVQKQINKVIDNLKNAWETNPNISFGELLNLIESHTNLSIYQLTDENIIALTEKMDISDYVSKEDIIKILNNLQIITTYDNSDSFAGYTITSSENIPLKSIEKIYKFINIDYAIDIKDILKNNNGFECKLVCEDILFNTIEDAKEAISDIKEFYDDIFDEMDE